MKVTEAGEGHTAQLAMGGGGTQGFEFTYQVWRNTG